MSSPHPTFPRKGCAETWSRDRRNVEQGPACGMRPWSRSRARRSNADSMRVSGVRSPKGPLFRPSTRPDFGDATVKAHTSTRASTALHPAPGGRWSAEQGPRLRGCDHGTGRERVATGPMRVSGVRSPEGPLFRPATRHPSTMRSEPAPPSAGAGDTRLRGNDDRTVRPGVRPATWREILSSAAPAIFRASSARRHARPCIAAR